MISNSIGSRLSVMKLNIKDTVRVDFTISRLLHPSTYSNMPYLLSMLALPFRL